MEIFCLGNAIGFFLRDGMNDPLCLENLFGNPCIVLPVFNEQKTTE